MTGYEVFLCTVMSGRFSRLANTPRDLPKKLKDVDEFDTI